MGQGQERLIQEVAGMVEEVPNGWDAVPEDRWVVEGGSQVGLVGSLDLVDRQNIQVEVDHMAGSLGQGRKHQVVVHSLYRTGQGGSSHQSVVEESLEERMDHHAVVLVEVGPAERHSNSSGNGQLSSASFLREFKNGQIRIRRKATEISTWVCALRTGLRVYIRDISSFQWTGVTRE